MQQAILFRNEAGTIILFDVPASIQDGQDSTTTLRSWRALESPYPSTEPKGTKRETAMANISPNDHSYHESIQQHISRALNEIQEHLHAKDPGTSWCHPRHALITDTVVPIGIGGSSSTTPVVLSTTELRTSFPSLRDLEGSVVCNIESSMKIINITTVGAFFIPPRSTFILASLEQGLPALLSSQANFSLQTRRLDLILVDPPWSNRSVRHSGAYQTQENQGVDPFEQALHIMDMFGAPQGLAAIWITNKTSIRTQVLERLQFLGFFLHEEWMWIKTTSHGEPVTQLDGIWRRPYEILLLFRKNVHPVNAKRRVIAAVPDVHSRKPCLKELLEELLPPDYSALELFARSLTAGWWSWGDEVLKFQHESYWDDCERSQDQAHEVDDVQT
ncbi:hypothetical protein H2200_003325 [Cladophialophora chaetospira]|uniref:MT-A70-domain-containing protein n=1 Tax=Cladophialophora chaetospira TaxID=386627 RepID=A0AA39CMM4_9EURO|nr:hypothetical protein H2200_003325 [Cladophialophora chaetospira]